jgi:hypothetical protein
MTIKVDALSHAARDLPRLCRHTAARPRRRREDIRRPISAGLLTMDL